MNTNDQTTTAGTTKTQTRKGTTTKPRRMARESKAPAGDERAAASLPAAIEPTAVALAPTAPTASSEPRVSKQAIALELLSRAEGASLDELIAATGWLPHSTRAALTGLRKKAHAIERSKSDGRTSYRIIGDEG